MSRAVTEMAAILPQQLYDTVDEDVECFREDEELMAYYGGCDKNPGHRNLIRMNELRLQMLPKRMRDTHVLKTIHLCAKLVVRIIVGCTSPNRPKTDQFYQLVGTGIRRTASGYVRSVSSQPHTMKIQSDCSTQATVYGEVDIITNKHVVFDDIEAANTTIELFYDNFSKKGVKILHGLHLRNSSDFLDVSHVTCVSRDPELVRQLAAYKDDVIKSLADIPPHISASGMCVAISHPHGLPKTVSVGDIIEQEEPEYELTDKIWTWHLNGIDSGATSKKTSRPYSTGSLGIGQQKTSSQQQRHRNASGPASTGLTQQKETNQAKDRPHSTSSLPQTYTNSVARRCISETPAVSSSSPEMEEEGCSNEGRRLTCRRVSRYMTATCRGSSGGPVFLEFGSSKKQLFCFIHSRYDRQRKMNVSRRKNIF